MDRSPEIFESETPGSIFTENPTDKMHDAALRKCIREFVGDKTLKGDCAAVIGGNDIQLWFNASRKMLDRIDNACIAIGDRLDSPIVSREDAIRYQFGKDEEERIEISFVPKTHPITGLVLEKHGDESIRNVVVKIDLSGDIWINDVFPESLENLKYLLFGTQKYPQDTDF